VFEEIVQKKTSVIGGRIFFSVFFFKNPTPKKMNPEASVKLPRDVCARLNVGQFTKITFVASQKERRVPGERERVIDLARPALHPDGRPVSICTQYLWWMFGDDAVLDSQQIDIWQTGTELFLFLADTYGSDEPVRIKFPTFGEWSESQKDLRIPHLITDEQYAHTLRKQVQSEFKEYELNPQQYPLFVVERAGLIAREGYDPVELYKEYLRNLIRRRAEQSISFPTYQAWAQSQRDLGLYDAAITEDAYAASLHHQAWEKVKLDPPDITSFLQSHWEVMQSKPDVNPIELYKEHLRDFVRAALEWKKTEQAAGPYAEANAEAHAEANAEARAEARAEANAEEKLRVEPSLVQLGLLPSPAARFNIQPKTLTGVLDLTLDGTDTMQTIKEKVSAQTGIPVESIRFAIMGREATRLEELVDGGDATFTVLDRRRRARPRVLVMCQRRASTDRDQDRVRRETQKLEQLIENYQPNAVVEYLTSGVQSPNFEADYKFEFTNDARDAKSAAFIAKNQGAFDMIVLHTCGLRYMVRLFPALASILKPRAKVIVTRNADGTVREINQEEFDQAVPGLDYDDANWRDSLRDFELLNASSFAKRV